jgi:hypothetical protein
MSEEAAFKYVDWRAAPTREADARRVWQFQAGLESVETKLVARNCSKARQGDLERAVVEQRNPEQGRQKQDELDRNAEQSRGLASAWRRDPRP